MTDVREKTKLETSPLLALENKEEPQKDSYLVASAKDLGNVISIPLAIAGATVHAVITTPWAVKQTWKNKAYHGSIVKNACGVVVSAFQIAARCACATGLGYMLFHTISSGISVGSGLLTVGFAAASLLTSVHCNDRDMKTAGYGNLSTEQQPAFPWQKPNEPKPDAPKNG